MTDDDRHFRWRCAVLASAIVALTGSAAPAKDSTASLKEAEQYVVQGNLKAAEIQLRNAIRAAPQDPLLRARLAEVYLRLGDAVAAECGVTRYGGHGRRKHLHAAPLAGLAEGVRGLRGHE